MEAFAEGLMPFQPSYKNGYMRDIEEGLRELPPAWDEVARALHEQGYQFSPDYEDWVHIKTLREAYVKWCKIKGKAPIWMHPQTFGRAVAMAYPDCPKVKRRGSGRAHIIGPGSLRTPDWVRGGVRTVAETPKKSVRDWLSSEYGIEIDQLGDGTYLIRHVVRPETGIEDTEEAAIQEGIRIVNEIADARGEPRYRSEK